MAIIYEGHQDPDPAPDLAVYNGAPSVTIGHDRGGEQGWTRDQATCVPFHCENRQICWPQGAGCTNPEHCRIDQP
jgi:hypothetical protein